MPAAAHTDIERGLRRASPHLAAVGWGCWRGWLLALGPGGGFLDRLKHPLVIAQPDGCVELD
jgi:hypothetical protein